MRAYLQLLRLPAVFTAMADIAMGYLFTHESLEPVLPFALLVLASSGLYLAGMVLNDYFDRGIDAVERPTRPIPSGRVSTATARWLGIGLLVAGSIAAVAATWVTQDARPAFVAAMLTGAVIVYDRWLKRTSIGPLAMGSCRMLNVLLGMSLSLAPWQPVYWTVAAGIGVYITGVTLFARQEATQSRRGVLILATLVLLAGIALLDYAPSQATGHEIPLLRALRRWHLFWLLVAGLIGWRCVLAIVTPTPERVQSAVKNSLIMLIVLDAGVVLAVHGPVWAVAILMLLLPAMYLGRWIYVT